MHLSNYCSSSNCQFMKAETLWKYECKSSEFWNHCSNVIKVSQWTLGSGVIHFPWWVSVFSWRHVRASHAFLHILNPSPSTSREVDPRRIQQWICIQSISTDSKQGTGRLPAAPCHLTHGLRLLFLHSHLKKSISFYLIFVLVLILFFLFCCVLFFLTR